MSTVAYSAAGGRIVTRIGDVELYDYQVRALSAILTKLATSQSVLFSMPTGLGKTIVAAFAIKNMSAKKVLIVVPTLPLASQWRDVLQRLLGNEYEIHVYTGEIQKSHRKRLLEEAAKSGKKLILIATPQTLVNDLFPPKFVAIFRSFYGRQYRELSEAIRNWIEENSELLEKLSWVNLAVFDEAHTYVGAHDGRLVALACKAAACYVLGLTATPRYEDYERLAELADIFNELVKVDLREVQIVPPRRIIIKPMLIDMNYKWAINTVAQAAERLAEHIRDVIRNMYGCRTIREISNLARTGTCPDCVRYLALLSFVKRLRAEGWHAVKHYKVVDMLRREAEKPLFGFDNPLKMAIEFLDKYGDPVLERAVGTVLDLLNRYSKIIVFTDTVSMAERLYKELSKSLGEDSVALLIGKQRMSMDEQWRQVSKFRERSRVLICTKVGELGIDIPAADAELWFSVPDNVASFIQRFGRVLRRSPGKKSGDVYLLLDPSDLDRLRDILVLASMYYGFDVDASVELPEDLYPVAEVDEPVRFVRAYIRNYVLIKVVTQSGKEIYCYMLPEEFLEFMKRVAGVPDIVPIDDLIEYVSSKGVVTRVKARGYRVFRHGREIINASPTLHYKGFPTQLRGSFDIEISTSFTDWVARAVTNLAGFVRFARSLTPAEAMRYLEESLKRQKRKASKKPLYDPSEIAEKLSKSTGIEFRYIGDKVFRSEFDIDTKYEKVRFSIIKGEIRLGDAALTICIYEPRKYGLSAKLVMTLEPEGLLICAKPIRHVYEDADKYVAKLAEAVRTTLSDVGIDKLSELASKISEVKRVVTIALSAARKVVSETFGVDASKIRFGGLTREICPIACITIRTYSVFINMRALLVAVTKLISGEVDAKDIEDAMLYVMVHEAVHAAREMKMRISLSEQVEEEDVRELTDRIIRERFGRDPAELFEKVRRVFQLEL